MTNQIQIEKLAAAIAEFETELARLNQQKTDLASQRPGSPEGQTPSEIAKAAQVASMEDQKRRSELESINAAIAAMTQHLTQKQLELTQAQRQQRREALTVEVEAAQAEMDKEAAAIAKLTGELRKKLFNLKALADQAQPAYSDLQREFTDPGGRVESLFTAQFVGLPVLVRQGECQVLQGEKLDFFAAERRELNSNLQARRAERSLLFEQGRERRELESLIDARADLERTNAAKESELEDLKQKLQEARSANFNTRKLEGAIARAEQVLSDLNKQISNAETEIVTKQEVQNGTAA